MAFDPNLVDKYKKPKSVPTDGFDPSLVDVYKGKRAQVTSPPPAEVRPGRVGRALDFTRRAFMGDIDPARRNFFQDVFRDATDAITGTSYLLGKTGIETGKLALDAVKSGVGPMKSILGVTPASTGMEEFLTSPAVKRIQDFPEQVAIATSPEGKKIAKEEFIGPAVDSFKKSFRHPIKAFDEHPLFTVLDWSTALDVVGGGVKAGINVGSKLAKMSGKVGAAAKLADVASTARKSLPVAPRGEILREYSKNPLIKYGLEKPIEKVAANEPLQQFMSQSPVLKYIAPEQFLTPEARAGRVAEKVGQASQAEFYRTRNARMTEAMDKFNSLPENERQAFVAVIQGRATPRYQSPQFKQVYDWYKNTVADEQTKFGLSEETVKRVAYQPLAVARGLLTPDDYKLALRGDTGAISKVRRITDGLAEARVRVQENAIKEWMGKNIKQQTLVPALKVGNRIYKGKLGQLHIDIVKRIKNIGNITDEGFFDTSTSQYLTRKQATKQLTGMSSYQGDPIRARTIKTEFGGQNINKIAAELAHELAPDPIYFPSVFAEKVKLSDFLPQRFLQKFKPGFMKGRTGAYGFIEKDPAAAFAIHQAQVEKFLENEALITSVKDKFALPLSKASDLKDGYKIFAPDGYIGFYKGSMPLQEAFLRGVGMGQDIDAAFSDAVSKVMPQLVQDKSFIGVRKPKLYQVPADVATKLQDMIQPSAKVPELFKLIYDKPLAAFKFSVLSMSPRWVVNNTVGNIMTTMMGRVSPESFIKAGSKAFSDIVPPEVMAGGFRRSEFPNVKRVITPSSGIADKVTGFFSGRAPTEGPLKDLQNVVSRPVKGVTKFADTIMEVNTAVEDLFRKATFVDKANKAAIEQITKQTASGIVDMKQMLDKFLQRGSFAESNVAKVAGEMLKKPAFKDKLVGDVNRILNDYQTMSKFERNVVRRVIPFWSWWKFMNMTFWTMPVKDPIMAQTIKQLGQVGMELSEEEWKANGLNAKEVPNWMRGNVILGLVPEDKMLEMLNTRSINPLTTAIEWPGIAPQIQVLLERRTGKRFPFGTPFTNPNETEVGGINVRRTSKGNYERIEHPTPPPLISHILRQLPQVQMAEAAMVPYRTYSGSPLFSGEVVTKRGRPIPVSPGAKLSGILGLPITETDYRALRKSRQTIRTGGRKIERQIKRSQRAQERIKLGQE